MSEDRARPTVIDSPGGGTPRTAEPADGTGRIVRTADAPRSRRAVAAFVSVFIPAVGTEAVHDDVGGAPTPRRR